MTPAEAQQCALHELEELGRTPVVLQEDAQLPNLARIQIASSTRPVHVLSYNPAVTAVLPYLVCFQCGLAKRTLLTAADERFNVASTAETYSRVEKLVRQKKSIPSQMVSTYTQMITDGLGTQLRSMPIGIRVDRELYQGHPELRARQRAAAERNLKENVVRLVLLASSRCHRKSPPPQGCRPSYRLDQDFQCRSLRQCRKR